MAALTPRVVRTARGRVEVAEAGSGPAVLVSHGIAGDWRQARTIAEDLADRSRVLLVTRPGYGRTPLSSGRTFLEQAALFTALLDALEVSSAAVLGISGGGPAAYAFAATTPQRCDGLLLCCAVRAAADEVPPSLDEMRKLAAVPGVWSALAGLARAVNAARRAGGHRVELDLAACTPRERELLARPEVRAALQRFEEDRLVMLRGRGLRNDTRQFDAAPPAWPAGVELSTVVMHGDVDDVVPVSHAHQYAAEIPGARLEVLEGLGHVVPLFARDAMNAALADLVSR